MLTLAARWARCLRVRPRASAVPPLALRRPASHDPRADQDTYPHANCTDQDTDPHADPCANSHVDLRYAAPPLRRRLTAPLPRYLHANGNMSRGAGAEPRRPASRLSPCVAPPRIYFAAPRTLPARVAGPPRRSGCLPPRRPRRHGHRPSCRPPRRLPRQPPPRRAAAAPPPRSPAVVLPMRCPMLRRRRTPPPAIAAPPPGPCCANAP
jgi:hypothetical protein